MNDASPEVLLARWDAEHNEIAPETSTLSQRFEIQVMQTLAEGVPVTSEMLANGLGVPNELIDKVFELARQRGGVNKNATGRSAERANWKRNASGVRGVRWTSTTRS